MSAARRLNHKQRTLGQRVERLRHRRRLACRAQHWRAMWLTRSFEDFRKPWDQMVRVAYVIEKCRSCHITLAATVCIGWDEEMEVRGTHELQLLAQRKITEAQDALWREGTPTKVRMDRIERPGFVQSFPIGVFAPVMLRRP